MEANRKVSSEALLESPATSSKESVLYLSAWQCLAFYRKTRVQQEPAALPTLTRGTTN